MIVMELCGLYGSGKTTLHRKLLQDPEQNTIGFYRLPRLRNLSHFAISALRIFPMVCRAGLDQDWQKRFKLLIYLDVLVQDLNHSKRIAGGSLLWEEGPLAIHAFLRCRIRRARNQEIIDRELSENLQKVVEILDGLIWLDAPDAVLVERIRTRSQPHRLQQMSKDEALGLHEEYRSIYEDMMEVCSDHGVPILRVSTAECDPEATLRVAREYITSAIIRRTHQRGNLIRN